MLTMIILSVIILLLAFVLLGINILLKKNGSFPDGHVGNNKAMNEKGINCATTQDREAQKQTKKL